MDAAATTGFSTELVDGCDEFNVLAEVASAVIGVLVVNAMKDDDKSSEDDIDKTTNSLHNLL